MDPFFTPVFASALWVGGGSLGLLLIVVFVRLLLCRKTVSRFKDDFTKLRDQARETFMKTLFKAEGISQDGHSGTIQKLKGVENVTARNLRGGSPSLTGSKWSAQSGPSPVRGHDGSALMISQLG